MIWPSYTVIAFVLALLLHLIMSALDARDRRARKSQTPSTPPQQPQPSPPPSQVEQEREAEMEGIGQGQMDLDQSRIDLLHKLPATHPFRQRIQDVEAGTLTQEQRHPTPRVYDVKSTKKKQADRKDPKDHPGMYLEFKQLGTMWPGNRNWETMDDKLDQVQALPKMRRRKRSLKLPVPPAELEVGGNVRKSKKPPYPTSGILERMPQPETGSLLRTDQPNPAKKVRISRALTAAADITDSNAMR